MEALRILPENLPVFRVWDALHPLDVREGVLQIEVDLSLCKTPIHGVVKGLCLPVGAVWVVRVGHFPACGVLDVSEGLLFVQADDPAGGVGDKILPVGVEIAQQPVGDVLPLYLPGDVCAQVGRRAGLPRLQVNPAGGVDLFLKCSKLSVEVPDADLDRAVRVDDALDLVAGLLDIGPEWLRLPGVFLLCGLEIPFIPVGVDPAFHLAGVADVELLIVCHAVRHSNPRRDGRLGRPWRGRRLCLGISPGPWREAVLGRLWARGGLENGGRRLLEMGGAPAARVKRGDHGLPLVEGLALEGLVDGVLLTGERLAHRAHVGVPSGIDDQVAVAHVPARLGLPDILGIPEIVGKGRLGGGDGVRPVAVLLGCVLHGRVFGRLFGGGLFHAGVFGQ